MRFSILKLQKNRKFSYSPRYYNDNKVKFERRYNEIKTQYDGEEDNEEPNRERNLREQMQMKWDLKTRSNSGQKFRIMAILLVLLLTVFILYRYL